MRKKYKKNIKKVNIFIDINENEWVIGVCASVLIQFYYFYFDENNIKKTIFMIIAGLV